ncbi:MAG: replication initiator protein A [Clostridium sp.]|uniref:replication initiator protein A n=1 Tax=Clostridium sp. TaxID=1506 RepID=UPI0029158F72|nr:replication initiator protein A [Clostridium sp.]MDU4844013.1 replication initiator protein A [Leclercia adecarboxylata]MDU7089575.1 replication initiator protein A [Clostridium sp.]
MSFNYITKEDKTKDLFYKIPKQFMLEEKYKKMKDSAKILYSILYERTNLSIENNWFDDKDRAFIICTFDEIQTFFGCSRDKVNNALKDLEKFSLIKKDKIKGRNGDLVNVLYIAHVETTNDTLKALMEKHQSNYNELSNKKKEYKREYNKKQSILKKAKRESKLVESENQTTIANTTIPRVKNLKLSNSNGSLKIRLRVVRKSDYRNTDFSNTDTSMYVCNDKSQNKTILDLYKNKIGEVSLIAKKELESLEGKLELDLCELIFINAKNNKRINNLEKYIVSKLKGISKKDIKTISEYEADVKSYSEKTYNKKIFSNNKSDKTPKVRTRFHNINESFRNYAPDELEKVIIESQKAKGLKSDNPIHNLYEIAIEHGLKKLPSPMSVENVINYAKENNLEIPKFDTSH